jgi:repressor LexA
MQNLCNFADQRARNFSPTKHTKQIDMINIENVRQLAKTYSLPPACLFYNILYEVRTHRGYYKKNSLPVKREEGKFLMGAGERIKRLRQSLGLTQKEFASRIGITYEMLGLYERGRYSPPEKVLKLISSTFGVSYEWLKTGQGEMWEKREKALLEELEAKTREVLEKLVRIPVVGRAGAGFPESPADMDVVGWVLVSKETFQKGGKFSVQVHGDSMEPTLHDGDFVVFKTYVGDGSDIPNGKVVVVRNHYGELIVKRLTRVNGSIVLTSDNPKYPPIPPEQFTTEDLRIVGVAVKIVREIEV